MLILSIFKKYRHFKIFCYFCSPFLIRKDAGVVDRGGLENRCTRLSTEGSNPSLSASEAKSLEAKPQGFFNAHPWRVYSPKAGH